MFGSARNVAGSVATLAAFLAINTFVFGRVIDNTKLIVIFLVTNLALLGLARAQRRSASRRDGWNYLTVSLAQWLVAGALLGLTGLFLYVFYFVGSERADAASQLFALQLLIAGFATMSALMCWATFSSFTRWNGEGVEQATLFLGHRAIRFTDIVDVRETWLDNLRIESANGTTIQIPKMHNGAHAFAEELARRLGGPSAPQDDDDPNGAGP
jgi:hypothetical protein